MRRLIAFPCVGETLVGSLDQASGSAGLLIVSAGNEIRCGAHRGMALLAQRLAAAGHPVFRYDRRGVGDSTGDNRGFRESAPDIAAAAATFAAEVPQMRRLVAFGNCDAATALALFHCAAGVDALVLANPWTLDEHVTPPPAAIRAHDGGGPREWLRRASGGVQLGRLFSGLRRISDRKSKLLDGLAAELMQALATIAVPVTILLAERDTMAIAFASAWDRAGAPGARATFLRRATASHSFASVEDKQWLFERVLAALRA